MMTTAVIAAIVKSECLFKDGMTNEQILREALSRAKQNWMEVDPNKQLTAGVAVAYSQMDDKGKKLLKATTDTLRAINAATQGVPVNMSDVFDNVKDLELFPLQKIWDEV